MLETPRLQFSRELTALDGLQSLQCGLLNFKASVSVSEWQRVQTTKALDRLFSDCGHDISSNGEVGVDDFSMAEGDAPAFLWLGFHPCPGEEVMESVQQILSAVSRLD